jgi:hypothetical protein
LEPELPLVPEPVSVEEPIVEQPPALDEPQAQIPTAQSVSNEEDVLPSLPEKVEEPEPEPLPEIQAVAAATPAQVQSPQPSAAPPSAVTAETLPPAAAKPSTPAPHTRPSALHRASARYKTDQAVVLPSSFGTTVERIGVQFGSLNFAGESGDDIPDASPYVCFSVFRQCH